MDAMLLEGVMARLVGGAGEIAGLRRLTGGANMESWSFDWGGRGYVLRRAPGDALMAGRSYGHPVETRVIRLARAHGVLAPEVVGDLVPEDGLGSGYVMRRVEAAVEPRAILSEPAPGLLGDLARELARLHAIPLNDVPDELPRDDAAAMVAALRARFLAYGGDRPVMALALAWLEARVPPPAPPVLLHGDFRIGNLMADERGLAAVLDWELCHVGDRHQDLAFGCITSWRFGWIDRPAFGIGALDDLFAAYERESGVAVDRARFDFWLVYSTLWWGLCCLEMAEIWRSGRDRSLERAVIGRRASETEVDLLLLLEEEAPEAERARIPLPPPASPRRIGEPSHVEMLEALAEWIEQEVKAKATGRDRFQAAVALNALGMLTREGPDAHDAALAADILAGRATLATPGLLARLRREALTKLAADQPKYPSLAKARAAWVET
jgi:aminoglycoside phosphotransferase (APT) family kinase protein